MRSVARESFLPPQLREFAYDDVPLPIEEGQTIYQPRALPSAAVPRPTRSPRCAQPSQPEARVRN